MPTVSLVTLKTNTDDQFDPSSTHEVESGRVLFEALEEQGATLPHGCLAGSCGSCRIEILEGQDQLSPLSAIETDTVTYLEQSYRERFGDDFLLGKTIRLSCRAKVLGDIKICKVREPKKTL
jgi:ferredoxin